MSRDRGKPKGVIGNMGRSEHLTAAPIEAPAAAVSAREQETEWAATIERALDWPLAFAIDDAHAALAGLLAAVEQLRERNKALDAKRCDFDCERFA